VLFFKKTVFCWIFLVILNDVVYQFTNPQTDNSPIHKLTHTSLSANTHILRSFSQLSEVEVSKLLLSNHRTTCPLDSHYSTSSHNTDGTNKS